MLSRWAIILRHVHHWQKTGIYPLGKPIIILWQPFIRAISLTAHCASILLLPLIAPRDSTHCLALASRPGWAWMEKQKRDKKYRFAKTENEELLSLQAIDKLLSLQTANYLPKKLRRGGKGEVIKITSIGCSFSNNESEGWWPYRKKVLVENVLQKQTKMRKIACRFPRDIFLLRFFTPHCMGSSKTPKRCLMLLGKPPSATKGLQKKYLAPAPTHRCGRSFVFCLLFVVCFRRLGLGFAFAFCRGPSGRQQWQRRSWLLHCCYMRSRLGGAARRASTTRTSLKPPKGHRHITTTAVTCSAATLGLRRGRGS
jgi:hypothetical protein